MCPPPVPVFAALAIAGVAGAIFGVIVGLPALRLRTFYFAISTLGFATIITQIALAWQSVTGGGIGLPGPEMPAPFHTHAGFYFFCLAAAGLITWMTANIAHSRFGRGLIAVRDADVAAEATGIRKARLLMTIFVFTGASAAIAGGLFAALQTYITPDAFTFDLSVLFFISILIGGRGSILGRCSVPLFSRCFRNSQRHSRLGRHFSMPCCCWQSCWSRRAASRLCSISGTAAHCWPIAQSFRRLLLVGHLLATDKAKSGIALRGVVLSFLGVRAIDGVDLDVEAGKIHGLIGPNWQRQDYDPQCHIRFLRPGSRLHRARR